MGSPVAQTASVTFPGMELSAFILTFWSLDIKVLTRSGLRYKFSENSQSGVAFEFPISSPTDTLLNFRLPLDVIIRY